MSIFNKKNIYITLFAILYLSVAIVSTIHAISFFGLANAPTLGVMLACTFEIGQAAVLFSILTSSKDRSRIMPWVLMTMFTLVQVLGNVFSSYKYLMQHSTADLRYFKEPIFIWTDLPDNVTTVIITYLVGAILPISALLLTSMVTNYIEDYNKGKTVANLSQPIKEEEHNEEPIKEEEPEEEHNEEPIKEEEPEEEHNEEPEEEPIKEEEHKEEPTKMSHFINI